jgi:hypothetical protein
MKTNNEFINLKDNKVYIVKGHGIDCTNERAGTPVVIYHEKGSPQVFVREESEFDQKFKPYQPD